MNSFQLVHFFLIVASTAAAISDIVDTEGQTYHREFFSCKKGSTISEISTFYRPNAQRQKRVWAFGCRDLELDEDTTMNCQLIHHPDTVECMRPHSFVNGIGRLSNNAGVSYTYQLRCCQLLRKGADGFRSFVQLDPQTCREELLVDAAKSGNVQFGDSVLVGAISTVNCSTTGRAWKRRMCDFNSSAAGIPQRSNCTLMTIGSDDERAIEAVSKTFASFRLGLDECLRRCDKNALCSSVRYTIDGFCRLSYVSAAPLVCDRMTTISLKKQQDIWIPCWNCPK